MKCQHSKIEWIVIDTLGSTVAAFWEIKCAKCCKVYGFGVRANEEWLRLRLYTDLLKKEKLKAA